MKTAALMPWRPAPMKSKSLAMACSNAVASVVDHVIILNDRTIPEKWQGINQQAEVISVFGGVDKWNDYGNRLTLLARAAALGCQWVVWCDDDWTFPYLTKKALLEQIRDATERGCIGIQYRLREMWDSTHYRSDGMWNFKTKVAIQKNPLMDEMVHWRGNHLQPLHAMPLQVGDIMEADCDVLHWGMCTEELRKDRCEKHKKLDPENKYQEIGYDYMLDYQGIELTPLK